MTNDDQRKEAFRLIREAEEAGDRMKTAPLYIHGGYDEEGDPIPEENIGPWDAFEEAIRRVEENETAVRILMAQGRTEIHSRRLLKVLEGLRAPFHPETDPACGPDTD